MDKEKQLIFLSNGYKGGNITFTSDHINYLNKKKKEIILIDDNPKKTYEHIPKNIISKKIITNYYSKNSEKKLAKILLNSRKKIPFFTNYAF